MATRMQQRRGTASQWTTANPILAAGEIGFESDTSKFKIGDGINHWADLVYFANNSAIESLIDGAPGALDTLNELAASIGDYANFSEVVDAAIATAVSDGETYVDYHLGQHASLEANVHGIPDTALLETTTGAQAKADAAVTAANAYSDSLSQNYDLAGTAINEVASHNSDTTAVHGITNTADLATKTYADNSSTTAVSDHNSDTTSVHGIADTSALETTTGSQNKADAALDAAETYADSAVSTAVAALTKSSVGLGNVDNTADADKPVSTATQTALDAKASLAGATFTGDVTVETDLIVDGNLTVTGTTTTVSAQDLVVSDPLIYIGEGNTANLVDLGLVGSFDDGTYQHAGIVRDASAGTWKIFKGVTDEPTTTINFAQGSLDDLTVAGLTATTVTPSSGVVFTDGTQTKEGVASRTPIIQKTASYTLSSLTERDSLIEVSSSSGTTITIPANSAVAYPLGTSIDLLQTSTGQVTVAGDAGVTVNGTPGLKLRTQWSSATLFKRAENTWVVMGDLSA